MLAIANLKSIDYYNKSEFKQADNYYNENEMANSFYYGSAAKYLRLNTETIQPEALSRFIAGYHPENNEHLFYPKKERNFTDKKTKGKGKVESMSFGVDLVFNAPKDFTIASIIDRSFLNENELSYDEIMDTAIKRALDKMEKMVGRRTRKSETGWAHDCKTIAFVYKHETARPVDGKRPDPHKHAHAVLPDRVIGDDGNWYTFNNRILYKNTRLLGAIFRAELANELRKKGFEIEPIKGEKGVDDGKNYIPDSFKIKGITDEQRKIFSNRANKIKEIAKEGATAIDKQNLILSTREWKEGDLNKNELSNIWNKEAQEVGLTQSFFDSIKTNNGFKNTIKHIKSEEYLLKFSQKNGKILENVLLTKLYENEQYTGLNAEKEYTRLLNNHLNKTEETFVKKVKTGKRTFKNVVSKNYKLETNLNLKMAEKTQQRVQTTLDKLFNNNLIKPIEISNRQKPLDVFLKDFIKDLKTETSNKIESKKQSSKLRNPTTGPLLFQYGMLEKRLLNPDLSEEDKAEIRAQMEQLKYEIQNEELREKNKENPFDN